MTETGTDNARKYIRVGALGSLLATLCCLTPLLALLLGLAGFGVFVAYLDFFLLPALCTFLVVLIIGLWRVKRQG